jgi:hypothetical protein
MPMRGGAIVADADASGRQRQRWDPVRQAADDGQDKSDVLHVEADNPNVVE